MTKFFKQFLLIFFGYISIFCGESPDQSPVEPSQEIPMTAESLPQDLAQPQDFKDQAAVQQEIPTEATSPQITTPAPMVAPEPQPTEQPVTTITTPQTTIQPAEPAPATGITSLAPTAAPTTASTVQTTTETQVPITMTPAVSAPTPTEPTVVTTQPTPSMQPVSPETQLAVPQQPFGAPSIMQPPVGITQPPTQQPDLVVQSQKEYKEAVDVDEQQDEDSGNWYEKRKAWKRARPKYDEIRKLVSEIDNGIQEFLNKNKESEKMLEDFYINIGIEQGEVQKTLIDLIENLEKEKKSPDGLSETERKELINLQNKQKKELEQLKNDLNALKTINEQLRNAILETFMGQVKLAKSYEEQSLEDYYFISKTLNDKTARNKLANIETNIENVESIKNWINNDLRQYIDQSMAKTKEFMDKIKTQIETLKSEGITISKKLLEEQKAEELKKKKIEQEKAAEKNKGFFRKIMDSISSFFQKVWEFIKEIFRPGQSIERKPSTTMLHISRKM